MFCCIFMETDRVDFKAICSCILYLIKSALLALISAVVGFEKIQTTLPWARTNVKMLIELQSTSKIRDTK